MPFQPGQRSGDVEEASDRRFVRQHGFLVFTGTVAPEEIPDHRVLREERIDALMKGGEGARP
jgi:hypothetical protein